MIQAGHYTITDIVDTMELELQTVSPSSGQMEFLASFFNYYYCCYFGRMS